MYKSSIQSQLFIIDSIRLFILTVFFSFLFGLSLIKTIIVTVLVWFVYLFVSLFKIGQIYNDRLNFGSDLRFTFIYISSLWVINKMLGESSLNVPKISILLVVTVLLSATFTLIASKLNLFVFKPNVLVTSKIMLGADEKDRLSKNYNLLGQYRGSSMGVYDFQKNKVVAPELLDFLRSQEVNAVLIFGEPIEMDELTKTGLPLIFVNQTESIKGFQKNLTEDKNKVVAYTIVSPGELALKRLIDIVVALVGLFFTGLIALLIAPIVKKQSPGKLLFLQERIGQNGKRFKMYKFRSMHNDAEQRKSELLKYNELNTDLMFKMEDDPRIFPFGKKMRSWSIDEFPQFINVLKGEMSLVGTRPPTVSEYEKYELDHFRRMAVKPGITGMWQVNGRSNISDFDQVVALDTEYLKNWSFWLDVKILIKTLVVVLKKEGSK